MASDYWESKWAICPFYQRENGQKIVCEGVNEKSNIDIRFDTKNDKYKYVHDFCYSECDHTKCIIHKSLMSKYRKD